MNKDIYPKYSEPSFWGVLKFEFHSWVGRKFFKASSRFRPSKNPYLIDIGVGENYTEGWVHVDFYRSRIRKFWKRMPKRRMPEVETDLRFPLNCPSNVADGVYSGHTLEHLYPNHAYALISEIFRILKPGCWLRINVPDLTVALDIYYGRLEKSEIKFGAEAIGNLTQNYLHHSVWDFELLSYALKSQGFINISQVEFGRSGTDKRLIKEEEIRRHETLVVEAQKPL